MPERGFAFASEHPRDLFLARLAFHFAQVGEGAAPRHLFGDHKLGRRRCCDLRQMRDAQHLMARGQRTHLRPDRMRNFAPHVRVDLVEDEERDGILEREDRLDRQRHPRDFAARGDCLAMA